MWFGVERDGGVNMEAKMKTSKLHCERGSLTCSPWSGNLDFDVPVNAVLRLSLCLLISNLSEYAQYSTWWMCLQDGSSNWRLGIWRSLSLSWMRQHTRNLLRMLNDSLGVASCGVVFFHMHCSKLESDAVCSVTWNECFLYARKL